ncbi:MAG: hypothetical protein H3C33_16135 [Rhodocyclaceae bacterium]|nr:hypothetical protein [Rhodocyclaceae bacterium]
MIRARARFLRTNTHPPEASLHSPLFAAVLFQSQDFELSRGIFIDEKPRYYELRNETRKMTGAEAFAQYAPKD